MSDPIPKPRIRVADPHDAAGASPSRAPLAAVILAAGLGSRLGFKPKAALRIAGVSLLERMTREFRAAGIHSIAVVIGPYANVYRSLASSLEIDLWEHDNLSVDLACSQRVALSRHASQHPSHDLMLTLGDLPWLDRHAIAALIAAWHRRDSRVHALVPVVHGVRGHPLMISAATVARSLDTRWPGGLRQWISAQTWKPQPFVSENDAYISDLDTPDDLDALRRRLHPRDLSWP